jgi:LPXTG-motif cell wall-anchored protein
MTTEAQGYALAWIGVSLMILGGVLYLWKWF